MSLRLERAYPDFIANLEKLKNALYDTETKQLVDCSLQLVKKSGLRWRVLCLMSPFYSLFSKDVFSHLRADVVAKNILRYCEENEKYFRIRSERSLELQLHILGTLNAKTAHKYQSVLAGAINALKIRLIPNPEVMQWPENLADLGITLSQKLQTESALKQIVPLLLKDPRLIVRSFKEVSGYGGGVKIKKVGLYRPSGIQGRADVVKVCNVPISFSCIFDGSSRLTNIVLHTKKVIGIGGQRTAKQSYDLTTGSYLVRKKCVSAMEEGLLRYLKEHRPHGLTELVAIRKEPKERGVVKTQALERLYNGPLSILFGSPISIEQKLILFENLLSGLKQLHSLQMRDTERFVTLGAFHFDISPNNILVFWVPETGNWQAVIADFGLTCHLTTVIGTVGYRSPENIWIEQYGLNRLESNVIEHNIRYGQKKDIWALGLVLATILVGRFSLKGGNLAPLASIESAVSLTPITDVAIGSLQQQDIDRDIAAFKDASKGAAYNGLWDIVALMLRVDPDERSPVGYMYDQLEELKRRSSIAT
ncbi:MAG: hypothetical protein JSR37_05810 [Verrucomicrobia bacterium]|nr:hypothetical protein [Verrucomicrobiota bacterium]MBS0637137.1 hypothetical protein [Verrucomicrobiota bacterium]